MKIQQACIEALRSIADPDTPEQAVEEALASVREQLQGARGGAVLAEQVEKLVRAGNVNRAVKLVARNPITPRWGLDEGTKGALIWGGGAWVFSVALLMAGNFGVLPAAGFGGLVGLLAGIAGWIWTDPEAISIQSGSEYRYSVRKAKRSDAIVWMVGAAGTLGILATIGFMGWGGDFGDTGPSATRTPGPPETTKSAPSFAALELAGRVTSVRGPAPATTGDTCFVEILPARGPSNCKIDVICGVERLYGGLDCSPGQGTS